MEKQNTKTINGVDVEANNNMSKIILESGGKPMGIDIKGRRLSCMGGREMTILRLVGVVLTLVAAVVGGTNKETHIIPFTLVNGLPPLHVPYTAKWHYISSNVYLVVANAIACTYLAASLMFLRTGDHEVTLLPLLISDLIMVALLSSATGAAAGVGLIGVRGNSHTQWHKVCYMFEKYCHQGEASVVISLLGTVVFLSLVVLAALKLH